MISTRLSTLVSRSCTPRLLMSRLSTQREPPFTPLSTGDLAGDDLFVQNIAASERERKAKRYHMIESEVRNL